MTAPTSPFEDEGIPDPGDLEPEQAMIGQDELTSEPPHDYPIAVEDFGTTPAEQREGESLDGRLAREVPETPVAVEQNGGPAEEAAMHLEPEPGVLEI